jgi:hypothetical protein
MEFMKQSSLYRIVRNKCREIQILRYSESYHCELLIGNPLFAGTIVEVLKVGETADE